MKPFSRFNFRLPAILSVVLGCFACSDKRDPELIDRIYRLGLSPPEEKLKVYHLGHSLVNTDMPWMLEQLAGAGHEHRSQLGWGAPLLQHWEPDVPVNGYEEGNKHPHFQDVHDAISSQHFDVFVLTEMVEIDSAIRYFDSAKYLTKFAQEIHAKNPQARLYLYESWHHTNDPQGWVNRLDKDIHRYWEEKIVDPALTALDGVPPIYVVPAGQALSAFFKMLAAGQTLPDIKSPEDFFAINDNGEKDTIHLNDIGNYFVALVHYSTLYHKSPVGLSHELIKQNGEPYQAPSKVAAQLMQEVVWQAVRQYPRTGVGGSQR